MPPSNKPALHRLIAVGTSAGGLDALRQLVAALPPGLPAAVLIAMHVGAHRSELPALLSRHTPLPVRHARDGEPVTDGIILVAPPDHHLLVTRENDPVRGELRVMLSHGPKENHTRPAIDPLFRSAAEMAGPDVIGVVLTGYLDDGSVGLKAVKECGGIAVVQDPADATAPDMPASALQCVAADYCLPLAQIGPLLAQLALGTVPRAAPPPPEPAPAPAPRWVRVENSFARSMGNMQALQKIGAPSPFTCPDCNGTLWQIAASPAHFRCHTGHGSTFKTLMALQDQVIEQALWASVRALQEKAGLAQQMAAEPHAGNTPPTDYAAVAAQAQQVAGQLKALLTGEEPGEG